jgi:hypothetical protein
LFLHGKKLKINKRFSTKETLENKKKEKLSVCFCFFLPFCLSKVLTCSCSNNTFLARSDSESSPLDDSVSDPLSDSLDDDLSIEGVIAPRASAGILAYLQEN